MTEMKDRYVCMSAPGYTLSVYMLSYQESFMLSTILRERKSMLSSRLLHSHHLRYSAAAAHLGRRMAVGVVSKRLLIRSLSDDRGRSRRRSFQLVVVSSSTIV